MWESVHLETSQHFRMMTWGVCQMCCSFIIHWLSSLGYYRLKAKTLLKSTMTLMCILKIFPPVSFLTLKSIERSSLLNLVLLRISFNLSFSSPSPLAYSRHQSSSYIHCGNGICATLQVGATQPDTTKPDASSFCANFFLFSSSLRN